MDLKEACVGENDFKGCGWSVMTQTVTLRLRIR